MAFNFNPKSEMLQNIKHFELCVGTPNNKQTNKHHPDFEAILALR